MAARRRTCLVLCATLAALAPCVRAFERPGAAAADLGGADADANLANLMQKAGLGSMDGDKMREAMQAMMAGGEGLDGLGQGMEGLGKMMQDMMGNPEMLAQVEKAMSDPEAQQQMMQWAEKLQESLMENPQMAALAKQFENMDLGGNFAKAMEDLQNNPQMKEMAEQLKGELEGLEEGGMDSLSKAINVGQEVFKKMMADPSYLEQFGETMKQMLPPEALANMEEQIKAAMEAGGGAGGMPDLEQLKQAMGGWNKDEM